MSNLVFSRDFSISLEILLQKVLTAASFSLLSLFSGTDGSIAFRMDRRKKLRKLAVTWSYLAVSPLYIWDCGLTWKVIFGPVIKKKFHHAILCCNKSCFRLIWSSCRSWRIRRVDPQKSSVIVHSDVLTFFFLIILLFITSYFLHSDL